MSATPVRVQRLPTPYVTYALIAANVGVWLVTLACSLVLLVVMAVFFTPKLEEKKA